MFSYDVDMRVPGIPPARLVVEERVGQPVKQRRSHTVDTVHRWTWPGGEVSNCWLTYRFRGGRSATQVDLTWRLVVPGAIDGQPIDRSRLDTAVGKAPERYLHTLAATPPWPAPSDSPEVRSPALGRLRQEGAEGETDAGRHLRYRPRAVDLDQDVAAQVGGHRWPDGGTPESGARRSPCVPSPAPGGARSKARYAIALPG